MEPETCNSRVAGGDLADVCSVYFTDPARIIEQGWAAVITDQLAAHPEPAEVRPELHQVFQDADGRQYGVPTANYSMNPLHNRDLFERAGPGPGRNPAAGRPVTVSGHTDVYTGYRAVDGDPATYWESANGAFPQTFTVDLGQPLDAGRRASSAKWRSVSPERAAPASPAALRRREPRVRRRAVVRRAVIVTGMSAGRIPVLVLTGYLGAGKTTLLNHLLRNRAGVRIGAVVNDFGSIPVDAMTVAGQVDALASFGNGCLCCAVDTEDLDLALDRLARPGSGLDLIVVEASGLAEPPALVRMILASANRHIVYGGLVQVVDAAEPRRTRHTGVADLLVLNKTDRVDPEARDALEAELRRLGGGAPVVTAVHGRIDPRLLLDPEQARAGDPGGPRQLSFADLLAAEAPPGEHPHAGFDSVAFTSAEPLSPGRLMRFLDTRPAGLYRIKGTVSFGAERFTVHAVGRFLRFSPAPAPGGTELVLIGAGIDAEALRKELGTCVTDGTAGPSGSGSGGLGEVLRYVDDPDDSDEPFTPGNPHDPADSGETDGAGGPAGR